MQIHHNRKKNTMQPECAGFCLSGRSLVHSSASWYDKGPAFFHALRAFLGRGFLERKPPKELLSASGPLALRRGRALTSRSGAAFRRRPKARIAQREHPPRTFLGLCEKWLCFLQNYGMILLDNACERMKDYVSWFPCPV